MEKQRRYLPGQSVQLHLSVQTYYHAYVPYLCTKPMSYFSEQCMYHEVKEMLKIVVFTISFGYPFCGKGVGGKLHIVAAGYIHFVQ